METLTFEKRGCDFDIDEIMQTASDIANHRIITTSPIEFKNGRFYTLEITSWNKAIYRTTYKRNSSIKLKHPIFVGVRHTMCFRNSFKTYYGCFGDLKLDKKLNKELLPFTEKSILKVINKYSVKKYDKIELVDMV